MKFFIKDFFSKCDQIAISYEFSDTYWEIFNEKFHFLRSELVRWIEFSWIF